MNVAEAVGRSKSKRIASKRESRDPRQRDSGMVRIKEILPAATLDLMRRMARGNGGRK